MMFKKLKDFNEKNTALYFFVAVFILVFVLFINSLSNRKTSDKGNNNSFTINDSLKYAYDIKIKKNNEIILLNIKRYGNKYLLTKTEMGIESKYYIYYTDIYQNYVNEDYIIYNDEIIEDVDNKLYFVDYIKELVEGIESFNDNSKTCYLKDNTIKICAIDNMNITYENEDLFISYEIKNDVVDDFNINIINSVITDEPKEEIDNKLNT